LDSKKNKSGKDLKNTQLNLIFEKQGLKKVQ
jgi:hypothetical protein